MKKLLIFFAFLLLAFQVNSQSILNARPLARAQSSAKTYLTVLNDGNTVGWYESSVGNVTKDGSNRVSNWDDLSSNAKDLIQTTSDTYKPVWSATGLLFDGSNDYMNTATFILAQPENIYIVFRNVTHTAADIILDGYTINTALLRIEDNAGNPEIRVYGGSGYSSQLALFADNTFGLVRVVFSGASSSLKINDGTVNTTGSWGTGSMAGITLAAKITPAAYANIEVKELIVRKVDDSDADELLIANYLNAKYTLY